MTYQGWRIYYADGSVWSSGETRWEKAPQEGVLIVTVFYQETYRIWHEDHWDVENYCKLLNGTDYYWEADGVPVAGDVSSVPADLPDGAVKLGLQVDDDLFASVYAQANDRRVF